MASSCCLVEVKPWDGRTELETAEHVYTPAQVQVEHPGLEV